MAGSMSKARAMVTDTLRAGFPDTAVRGYPLRFIDYAKMPDPAGGVTVMTAVHTVTPEPKLGPDARAYEATVYVITEQTDTGSGDDVLELALEDALAAIDTSPLLEWSRAERTVFGRDLWPCYELTATVHAQIERTVRT